MRCGCCAAPFDPGDNYCRRCGAELDRRGLPTVVSRSLLPVPWEQARKQVIRGVAALAIGTLVEIARREAVRRASPPEPVDLIPLLSTAKPVEAKRGRFPWSRAPRGEYEVTETVIQRRVWFRR